MSEKIYVVDETKVEMVACMDGYMLSVSELKDLSDIIMFEDEVNREEISDHMDDTITDWISEISTSGMEVNFDEQSVTFHVALNKYAHRVVEKTFPLDEVVDLEEIEEMTRLDQLEFIMDNSEDFLSEWVNEQISTSFTIIE